MQVHILYKLPEERLELMRALKATDAYLVIWDMFQELRKVWKYSEVDADVEQAEKWRTVLAVCCERYNINIDEELE